jgi:membrane associated rhomboid family serine protease
MLPLRDLNRPATAPHVNRMLLLANVIVFIVYWLSRSGIVLNPKLANAMADPNGESGTFVMVPNEIIQGRQIFTVFTSMFMHDPSSLEAGFFHIFGNMLFLFVFGDNVEDAFGHFSYLAFYLFSGVAAALGYIIMVGLTDPSSLAVGVLGASGAISGVLGAYIVLYPKARILAFLYVIILPIPAIIFLGFWFVLQWLYQVFAISGDVAYWAHIAGFIAGMILTLAIGLNRKKAREARLRL